jgi:hypothetical protein
MVLSVENAVHQPDVLISGSGLKEVIKRPKVGTIQIIMMRITIKCVGILANTLLIAFLFIALPPVP